MCNKAITKSHLLGRCHPALRISHPVHELDHSGSRRLGLAKRGVLEHLSKVDLAECGDNLRTEAAVTVLASNCFPGRGLGQGWDRTRGGSRRRSWARWEQKEGRVQTSPFAAACQQGAAGGTLLPLTRPPALAQRPSRRRHQRCCAQQCAPLAAESARGSAPQAASLASRSRRH